MSMGFSFLICETEIRTPFCRIVRLRRASLLRIKELAASRGSASGIPFLLRNSCDNHRQPIFSSRKAGISQVSASVISGCSPCVGLHIVISLFCFVLRTKRKFLFEPNLRIIAWEQKLRKPWELLFILEIRAQLHKFFDIISLLRRTSVIVDQGATLLHRTLS